MAQEYILPDTLKDWPWPRRINPHYAEIKQECDTWIHQFNVFDDKAQRAFDKCNFVLLAALSNPTQDKERLWTCAANMIVFFVYDEYTDVEDAAGTEALVNIVMDALRYPHNPRPEGENVIGEIFRAFWERAIKSTTEIAQKRFLVATEEYVTSVIQESADRTARRIRSIEEYFTLRRVTIGAVPSYVGIQLHMNISDEEFYHPAVVKLTGLVTDLLILGNDMCSFGRENAREDDHNLIAVLMYNLKIDMTDALQWLARRHREVVDETLHCVEKELPWKLGTGSEISLYVEGLLNWVRAENSWAFESCRYFGENGASVKENRIVTFPPRSVLPSSAELVA